MDVLIRLIFFASLLPVLLLLAGCGSTPRSAAQAPPQMPADAPTLQAVAGTGGVTRMPTGGAGGDWSTRIDQLEDQLDALQRQFADSQPAIARLVRIEGDIRDLLSQMEAVIAARASARPLSEAPLEALPDASPALVQGPVGRSSGGTTPLASAGAQPQLPASAQAPVLKAPSGPREANNAPSLPEAPGLDTAVHLGSYRDSDSARVGWSKLLQRHQSELSSLIPTLSAVETPKGRFLRLQAAALPRPKAAALCARLERRGQYCVPTEDLGQPLSGADGSVASLP